MYIYVTFLSLVEGKRKPDGLRLFSHSGRELELRAFIFNRCNHATVRHRVVLLVHASCDVNYFITYTHSLLTIIIVTVFCPRAGPSLQTQELRPQFCSKADLTLQTLEPRLQFYWGWIGAIVSRCFPHPTLSLTSGQILKNLKRSQESKRGGEESGFG